MAKLFLNVINILKKDDENINQLELLLEDGLTVESNDLVFKRNSPYYLKSEATSVLRCPAKADLNLSCDNFYKISLTINNVMGSVILYIFFYDNTNKIWSEELVVNNDKENTIIVKIPANYNSSRIAFRVNGKGRVSLNAIIVEQINNNVANEIAKYFNQSAIKKDKLVNHYYQLIKPNNMFTVNLETFKNFFMLALWSENKTYIMEISDLVDENKALLPLRLNNDIIDIKENYDLYILKNINNFFDKLSPLLKSKGITKYVVKLINSGMGDILTYANMISYFSEKLGLEFHGIELNDKGYIRKYYLEFFDKIGLNNSYVDQNSIMYIKVNSLAEDLNEIYLQIVNLTLEQYSTICFIPESINTFSQMKFFEDFNKNIIKNSFHQYFTNLIKDSNLFAPEPKSNIELTIHLRLGDVAAIKVKDFVLIPFEVQSNRYQTGISKLQSLKKDSNLYLQFKLLDHVKTFVSELRKTDNNIKINLITDGYDLTRSKLQNSTIISKCHDQGLSYDINDINDIIDQYECEIHKIKFDHVCIGEKNVQDFINSVQLILNSDIIISSARGFVFGVLSNFKYNEKKKQIFFSPLRGNYFEVLNTLNVKMQTFSSFDKSIDNIIHDVRGFQDKHTFNKFDYVNYSRYAYYYTSSVNNSNVNKVGSPLDGALTSDRVSVYTEKEDSPFIIVYFDEEIEIDLLEVYFSSNGADNLSTITISISADGKLWEIVEELYSNVKYYINSNIHQYKKVKYIKLQKVGFGYLFLSAINIYMKKNDFVNLMQAKSLSNRSKVIFVYTPLYGLGGKLETIASAFGYLLKSTLKHIVVDWGRESKINELLAYPLPVDYENNHKDILTRSLSPSVLSHVLKQKNKIESERNLFQWKAPETYELNEECVFISRDSAWQFVNKHEHLYKCLQRLYSNIIPSNLVIERLSEIEKTHKLGKNYKNAVGVHVRHGNGEKYFSVSSSTWGVKPPSRDEIIKPIQDLLSKNNIETIILASDSEAVKTLVENEFGQYYKVIFISEGIQPISYGCNHTNSTFIKNPKRKIIEKNKDEIATFAELLCLSKCNWLIGGKSYFFNAIIGFSQCDADKITRIDNSTRYVTIENLKPIEDVNSLESIEVIEIFTNSGIMLDGVFFKQSSPGKIRLDYFDMKLFEGTTHNLVASLEKIKQLLCLYRLY